MLLAVFLLAAPAAASAKGSGHVIPAAGNGQTNCFDDIPSEGSARLEGCGLPGIHNTGPNGEGIAHCSSLTASGSITVPASEPGRHIENKNITGELVIEASKVVVNNVCVNSNTGYSSGKKAVFIVPPGGVGEAPSEIEINNSAIGGEDETTHSVEEAISDSYGGKTTTVELTADHDYLHDCAECFHIGNKGQFTLSNSVSLADGGRPGTTGAHYESVYAGFNGVQFTLKHDSLFNRAAGGGFTDLSGEAQTAVVFHDNGGVPCNAHWTITESILAGGQSILFPCGNRGAGTEAGSFGTFTKNIIARCIGKPEVTLNVEQKRTGCTGGRDTKGYFPSGGALGLSFNELGGIMFIAEEWTQIETKTWTQNIWNDDGSEVKATAFGK